MALKVGGAIFIHIPKTGGMWIRKYFEQVGIESREIGANHATSIELGKIDELTFCFVRHPLTWYQSYWKYKQTTQTRTNPPIDQFVDRPFAEFVTAALAEHGDYLNRFYSQFVKGVNYIGKQETLRDDFETLLRRAELPIDVNLLSGPEENKSIKPVASAKYTLPLAERVMRHEIRVARQFDYNYIPLDVLTGF
ncbi:hypothetical protein LCGC14_2482610 [marine sediment metagenome]|uniref:Sulfotransferase domain-containing protein n=1 Tax=marine sediment metagenome TaxID=412755 RepID=A0A0F9E0X9_9ZZZZ